MKRQARPFVVETKRSRKAPTNLWASTPLLQQELAAASAPEQKAEAFFTDRSKERAAEPARRILESLIVETPPPEIEALEAEEPAEAAAPRRRTRRGSDAEPAAEPARRGRPRRVETTSVETTSPDDARTDPRLPPAVRADTTDARSRKLDAPKAVATKTVATKTVATKPVAKRSPPDPLPSRTAAAVRPSPTARPAVTVPEEADAAIDGASDARASRSRSPRIPPGLALPPGQRWKRRLPQRLW